MSKILNKRNIVILIIGLIIIIGGFIIIKNNKKGTLDDINIVHTKDKKIDLEQLKTRMDNKENILVYYYNDDKISMSIKYYLDQNNIDYYGYDKSTSSDKDYQEFLNILNIDPDLFGMPAVIYIRDGEMFSNIINITEVKTVEHFVKEYNLS